MIPETSNISSSNRPIAVPVPPPTLPRTTTTNVITGSAGDSSSTQPASDNATAQPAARSLSVSGTPVGGTFGLDSLSLEAGAIGGATSSSTTLAVGGTGIAVGGIGVVGTEAGELPLQPIKKRQITMEKYSVIFINTLF